MPTRYRVIDLRPATAEPAAAEEIIVEGAKSPEAAARQALGIELVRSGSRKDLAARVYWQLTPDAINMVRLYTRVATSRQR